MDYQPLKCWAFVWINGSPTAYITRITAYTRKDLRLTIEEEIVMPWRNIYRQGGRIIKCVITQDKPINAN